MTDLLFEMGAPKYQLCIFLALASSQFLWSGKLKKKSKVKNLLFFATRYNIDNYSRFTNISVTLLLFSESFSFLHGLH